MSYQLAARGEEIKRYRPHSGTDLGAPPEPSSVAETVTGGVDGIFISQSSDENVCWLTILVAHIIVVTKPSHHG